MNVIYANESHIAAYTDQINAQMHKHWMLQLFICLENELYIQVNEAHIKCKAILVAADSMHSIQTGKNMHFTMLIDAASELGKQLTDKVLRDKSYYIFSDTEIKPIVQKFTGSSDITNIADYKYMTYVFFTSLGVGVRAADEMDDRIKTIIKEIQGDGIASLSLASLAKMAALSQSRLSHLFKEQTGIPLKSYLVTQRLYRAYLFLLYTGNITEAAINAGFDSSAHFAYTSKSLTGMCASDISKDSVFLKAFSFDF